ncbi:MAG: ABC-type transport auxiliary lipoprotein family protein [Verrucomicrobia bacterium]|nr:ABC-type transport auxiliary lipoprotein family protein [Verrucomicrobiota bacterium]
MNPRLVFVVRGLAATAGLLLGGCSLLPQAQVDPTRFYVLSFTPPAAPVAAPAEKPPVIHLRPVELASYIKAKPIIVRRGNNEIEFREYARWGEPLEAGIGRVLREDLMARGAAAAVLGAGLRATETDYDYALIVRVLACEGGAGGTVNFRAIWIIASAGTTPKEVARGEVQPTDLHWDGKNEGVLAAELSRAVGLLAADIAGGLLRSGK